MSAKSFPTRHSVFRWGSAELKTAGVPDAAWQAEVALRAALGITRADFLAAPEETVTSEHLQSYSDYIARLIAGVPLQYVLGRTEFYGREFVLTPAVLIPRADTETLVEVALAKLVVLAKRYAERLDVLDMCTGSGCVGLSLAAERKEAHCTLTDISAEALSVAATNAFRLGLSDRAELCEGDLWQTVKGRQFHLIASNPPYIARDEIITLAPVVQREPHLALDGGPDGLDFYRRMIHEAPFFLHPAGWLAVEIGATQGAAVAELFKEAGFGEITLQQDLAGRDRVCAGTISNLSLLTSHL